MSVELIFGLIIAVIVFLIFYYNRTGSGLDVNKDGKVDIEDAKVAVDNTVAGVTKAVKNTTKPRATKTDKKPAVKAKTTRAKKTNGAAK